MSTEAGAEHGHDAEGAAGHFPPPSDITRRPGVRVLRAALWAGIAASGLTAEYLRVSWLAHAPAVPAVAVATLIGVGGSALCLAGMEAIKASARREWRAGGGTVIQGRLGEHETAAQHLECEARLEAQDARIADIFELMQMVCDELRVDTSPADETRPMLRIVRDDAS